MSHEAMSQVANGRRALAERARLPWWFWVLFTAATVGLIGGPLLGRWLPSGSSMLLVTIPSCLVYVLAERLVHRYRGLSISSRTLRDFPSSRPAGIAFLVVGAVGIVAVSMVQRTSLGAAVVVLAVAVVLAVGAMVAMHRAILADLRHGRVRSA